MRIRTKQIGLVIIGAGMALGALVAACKATVEARDIIHNETLSKPQKALKIASSYALAIGGMALSALCFVQYNKIDKETIEAKNELVNNVVETIGAYRAETAEQTSIRKETAIWEAAGARIASSDIEIPFTVEDIDYASGDMLFYDQLHKSWFVEKKDRVFNAEKDIVSLINEGVKVPLNKYYERVGLSKKNYGYYLSWSYSGDTPLENIFTYSVNNRESDGLIYTVIMYKIIPDTEKGGKAA